MQESILRQNVLDCFSSLQAELEDLCGAIYQDADLIAWVHDDPESSALLSSQNASAREQACALFKQMQYLDNQAPREIIVLPGFVGASPKTLVRVEKVNQAKEDFKKSILALKTAKISTQEPSFNQQIDELLNTRSVSITHVMHKMGLARLHLKQCYRKIPVLKQAPEKISWTWAHTKAIRRISLEKAREMLLKRGDDTGIQIQLQKLSALAADEPLAIVQELAPHLRANIVLADDMATRLMIKGPVPIFFPCDPTTPYPTFKIPQKKSLRDQNRSIRNDVLLDPNPYLPAIRAHRYLKVNHTA